MQLCFIDEAGDLGVLRDPPAPNEQPVLAIAGLFVDAATALRRARPSSHVQADDPAPEPPPSRIAMRDLAKENRNREND